ncbi:uncharacterized protein BX664DRAFT_281426 [Halteromyces radiatus]|uniref:uncharacterized protein n=1 Tax=Halteromyces radiatus TaxID=101107 RepID=UPI00221F368C|nr:uncharacterized protein BX664DRAFT_281426 [Halteromyces radiatus]KAI8090028.1 hypothetical protein BX664DRAFT_281426 [Halteromyces radiatus]
MSSNETTETELKRIDSFVEKVPAGFYTIDQKERELCRQLGGNQQDCIKLNLEYSEMFSQMQKLGFFCALPMDPTLTYMECRRV